MQLLGQKKSKILFALVFTLTTIVASIYMLQAYLHFTDKETQFPFGSMLISVFGSYYIFLFFVPLVSYLKRRFDIISDWKFLFPHLLFAFILSISHIVLASLFNHLFLGNNLPFVDRIKYGIQGDFLLIFIGYCGVLATAYFIDFYFKFKNKESELIELQLSQSVSTKYLIIKDKGRLNKVPLEQIKYFETFDNYLKVHSESKVFLIRKTLKSLVDELKNYGFIRIHRSYAINTKYFQTIEKLKTGDAKITLTSGEQLKMSRSFKDNLGRIENL